MGQTPNPVCPTGVSKGGRMDGNGKWTGTTVLVVDDTAAGRYAMSALLRRAGYQVVPVASGNEALTELDVRLRRGILPDVALVDVDLPDTSGVELFTAARALPLPPRQGRERRTPAQRLGVGLRRPGLDEDHRAGRHPRRVVSAPLRTRAARLQLGTPGCRGRVPLGPAVLARHGRREEESLDAHLVGRA